MASNEQHTNQPNKIQTVIDYLDNYLNQLIQGNISMDKLTITKSLRGYYKNPERIAHCVLAEKIGIREPGNKPKPGDRIKFVHIVCKNKKALQGEKIETPSFIIQNKLKIDYSFYITNQIMKPLQQLLGLAIEEIWKNKRQFNNIAKYKNDIKTLFNMCNGNLEEFSKAKEKYCSDKIQNILFDKYLIRISNQKNGYTQINAFF